MDGINLAKAYYITTLSALSAIGSGIATSLGGWDTSLQTLIVFIAIDYFLGLLIALVWKRSPKSSDGTFESNACAKGLFRKGAMILLVYIAVRLDLGANDGNYIRTAVIIFFITNEGLSIVENLGIMGLPMPEIIKNAFAAIKSDHKNKKSR